MSYTHLPLVQIKRTASNYFLNDFKANSTTATTATHSRTFDFHKTTYMYYPSLDRLSLRLQTFVFFVRE